MQGKPHVAVIGAGAIGLSAALELVDRGCAVTVVEAAHVASGSSGRSIGVVGTQHVERLEIQLRVFGMLRMLELERHGLDFRHVGYMRLGRSEADMALFARSVEMQAEFGLPDAVLLDRAAILRLVPDLSVDGIAGAVFGPRNGYLDPHLYCGLLAEMIRARGGTLRQRCRLIGADRIGGGYRLHTTGGDVDADAVVLAPGPWAGAVARLFGHRLPTIPERHQAVVIRLPHPLAYTMPMVMDYVPGGGGTGLNFRHERAAELVAETHRSYDTAGSDPDDYDQGFDERARDELAALLLERLPGFAAAGLGRGWAGLYPKSPDGRPFVGPLAEAEPMLVAAAGAGGYGIQLSPAIGALAADWILDGAPTSMPEAIRMKPTPARLA